MADRRYIAQEITDSGQVEQVARGAMEARHDRATAFVATTLWSWLIAHIDDDGRAIGKPDALRSKLFARYMDLVTVEEVAEVVAWMNDVDLVVWYEVLGSPGERYLYSPRFATHQTLRTDRYGPSRHPAPPGWQPEDGHPYTKNPELRKMKPQRDSRRTARMPKRPVNKGEGPTPATGPRPLVATSETTPQPSADALAPRGDEASPHLASPHLTTPHPATRLIAASAAGSAETDELRSGTRGTRPIAETVQVVERAARVGRHYRSLTDEPQMYADGRVRDHFGTIHESHGALMTWAQHEAEQLADAEIKIEQERALEEPGIAGEAS